MTIYTFATNFYRVSQVFLTSKDKFITLVLLPRTEDLAIEALASRQNIGYICYRKCLREC